MNEKNLFNKLCDFKTLSSEEVEYLVDKHKWETKVIKDFGNKKQIECIIRFNGRYYRLYYVSNNFENEYEKQEATLVCKQKKEIEVWDEFPTSYYIATFSKNWSGEFDYETTFLLTFWEVEEIKSMIRKYGNKTIDCYFGTNEGWEEETISDLLNEITYKKISEETYLELCNFLDNGLPSFLYYDESYWEEQDEEDKDE